MFCCCPRNSWISCPVQVTAGLPVPGEAVGEMAFAVSAWWMSSLCPSCQSMIRVQCLSIQVVWVFWLEVQPCETVSPIYQFLYVPFFFFLLDWFHETGAWKCMKAQLVLAEAFKKPNAYFSKILCTNRPSVLFRWRLFLFIMVLLMIQMLWIL